MGTSVIISQTDAPDRGVNDIRRGVYLSSVNTTKAHSYHPPSQSSWRCMLHSAIKYQAAHLQSLLTAQAQAGMSPTMEASAQSARPPSPMYARPPPKTPAFLDAC